MTNRYSTLLLIWLILVLGVSLGTVLRLGQPERSGRMQAQNGAFCLPDQVPHFSHGFAFLKSQLGPVMGEPLECEHYDAAGNAYQKTTTGQAFYDKQTNTPMFTASLQHWAWTSRGLEQWGETVAAPEANSLPVSSSVRVMSYNILFGAGATPYWERRAAELRPFAYPGNRLPEILAVIKAATPDIVGIQEAAGWEGGEPPPAQQVAEELDMHYFLAPTPSGLHLLLLSKFEIIDMENLSDRIGNIGALRATVMRPDGQPLHVFVVHLDPFSATTRTQQINALLQEMAPYLQTPTILMGDTNVECANVPATCQEYQLLSEAGWRLVAKEKYVINQIWAAPSLAQSVSEINFPQANFDISDHLPVGAMIKQIAGSR